MWKPLMKVLVEFSGVLMELVPNFSKFQVDNHMKSYLQLLTIMDRLSRLMIRVHSLLLLHQNLEMVRKLQFLKKTLPLLMKEFSDCQTSRLPLNQEHHTVWVFKQMLFLNVSKSNFQILPAPVQETMEEVLSKLQLNLLTLSKFSLENANLVKYFQLIVNVFLAHQVNTQLSKTSKTQKMLNVKLAKTMLFVLEVIPWVQREDTGEKIQPLPISSDAPIKMPALDILQVIMMNL
mmetsp:Transcript_29102/g.26484  ORF Transcript_29102/g.26484 Transcript_29102/m.26484 type:complete len:234 (-) Transcript_29102:533-1234(-)